MISITLYKSKVNNHYNYRGNFILYFVILLLQRNKYWINHMFLIFF